MHPIRMLREMLTKRRRGLESGRDPTTRGASRFRS